MTLPESLSALLEPDAYPHPCDDIQVVETHISWVLLTGSVAYKLKKPVAFSFVDFSTLAQREHFCREELRCNARFAPGLYLGVVAVTRDDRGRVAIDGGGEVLEWAVKMRQFPAEAQLDRVVERGDATREMLETFGRSLARQHADLPAQRVDATELEPRVLAPARENFDDIRALTWTQPYAETLDRVSSASEAVAERHHAWLELRLRDGWTRECHGDLHLSNLVLLEDQVTAFDCLEFNPSLRWIDPQSDVAFLFMDCLVREREDLGYAFVDGYLDGCGDYDGARLLPFYAGYRSMVRAKVAALGREVPDDGGLASPDDPHLARFVRHLSWADAYFGRPPGQLVLMCGVSGSGKSYLARRLVPDLPAVRLRSDVARKAQAGMDPGESGRSAVGTGLYAPGRSDAVYAWLADVAADLLRSGEHVLVDATFLEPERREPFVSLGREVGRPAVVVHCDAPADVLRERVKRRARAGADVSDADLAVLEHQLETFEAPDGVIRFDTAAEVTPERLQRLRRQVLGQPE
ncbi:MAG: AAA family ATPase [Pseudomonadota bacterium]